MKVKEKIKSIFKNINFNFNDRSAKSKRIIVGIWVLVLTIFTIGYSYAAFFTVKTNKNNQTVTLGDLNISYGGSTSVSAPAEMKVMSDEEGMNQTETGIIYLQNTSGGLAANYALTVGYDMESFLNRSGYSLTDKLTPVEYIKIAVYSYANGTSTLIVGPTTLADLPVHTYDPNELSNGVSDSRYNRYVVLYDTLGASSTTTKTYQIKVWLSDKAPASVSDSFFYVNSSILSEADNSRMEYGFTGIFQFKNTAVANAKVDIQNGFKTATTDSNGNFTISGLFPGVYKVTISFESDSVKYNPQCTLVVKEGSNKNLDTGTRIRPSSDMGVPEAAYRYGTTVGALLEHTSITETSDVAKLKANGSYLIRKGPFYITGDNNSNLGTINFKSSTGLVFNTVTLEL